MRSNQITGPCDVTAVVNELWERAAPGLTQHELQWFSMATDTAIASLSRLENIVDGIGCLVASDGNSSVRSGSLQDHESIPSLMFFVGDSIRAARALVEVGDAAMSRLGNPELYKYTG